MLAKIDMVATRVADYSLTQTEGQVFSILRDDDYLDLMRSVIKEYIAGGQEDSIDSSLEAQQTLKTQFEQLRSKLRDVALREYTSFEFMEKLHRQEYLTRG